LKKASSRMHMIARNSNQAVRTHINDEKTLLICTIFAKKHKTSEFNNNEFNSIFNLFKQLFNVYDLFANQALIIAEALCMIKVLFKSLEKKYNFKDE